MYSLAKKITAEQYNNNYLDEANLIEKDNNYYHLLTVSNNLDNIKNKVNIVENSCVLLVEQISQSSRYDILRIIE